MAKNTISEKSVFTNVFINPYSWKTSVADKQKIACLLYWLSSIMYLDLDFMQSLQDVRGLIHKDIARDRDVVNKRLARMIIYSAVASRMLQSRIGFEGKVRAIERITLRILNEMGLGCQ